MDLPGTPPTPAVLEPLLEFVRPGARAHAWLAATIRDLKRGELFRPITILVPNDYAGRLARWQLARSGGYLNVATVRLPRLAELIARDQPEDVWRRVATIVEESAVREAIRLSGGPLCKINHRSLHVVLLDLFRELRRREIDLRSLDRGSLTSTTRAALDVYAAFTALLVNKETTTSIANAATRRLTRATSRPPDVERLGALVLWQPSRLDPAEARLLAAASRWIPLAAAFVDVDDARQVEDAPARAAADELARALQRDPPTVGKPAVPPVEPAEIQVIRAPDPAEEVREVIRAIAADVVACVPLYRIAVVYRQGDPYAALVRDTLAAADLPWVSSEGLRLTDSRPGRCLSGLLGLSDRKFTRESLLEWLETGPVLSDAVADISTASWDRLARAANVVRGADQWDSRLRALASTLEEEAAGHNREDRQPALAEAKKRQASEARVLAAFVVDLEKSLRPPAAGTTWAGFVGWARAARDRFVGSTDRWSSALRDAARACDEVLNALLLAERLEWETGIDLPTFLATLEGALNARRLPTGRVGEGVLVEPLTALNGLAFQRVYVLGLVDGAFPPSLPADPFFPTGGPDPLGRRPRQIARERQDFLVAVAAADGGRLTLTVPDSYGDRAAIPSRWLLELAGARSGRTIDASEFVRLSEADNPWLRVINSSQAAVQRAVAPADLEDRRLGEAARWAMGGRPFSEFPLARRANSPLGRAAIQRQEQRSSNLTRFDGNVSASSRVVRELANRVGGNRAMSASALQTWAVCGYRYFLERLVGVEPTEEPEESPTLDAREGGLLIHKILQTFFGELAADGRPVESEPYDRDDFGTIERIAAVEFAELERRGVVGHPLVWENTRGSILADLHSFLTDDSSWRVTAGVRPTRFEQGFGTGSRQSHGWPALEVDVNGVSLKFQGVIDRIDLDPTGTRAVVFDYKTGKVGSYASVTTDPVAAGQHIQLALYNQAVRKNLPRVTQVAAAYWFITARGEFKRVELTDDASLVDSRLAAVLGITTTGIRSGAFPQVPGTWGNGSFVNCGYCAFDRICPDRRDRRALEKANDPLVVLHASLGTVTSLEPEG